MLRRRMVLWVPSQMCDGICQGFCCLQDQLVASILPDLENSIASIKAQGEAFILVANRLARLISVIQTLPSKPGKVANGFWKWNTYSEFRNIWRSILVLLIEKQNHPIWAWSAEGGDGFDYMNKVNKVRRVFALLASKSMTRPPAAFIAPFTQGFFRDQFQCWTSDCFSQVFYHLLMDSGGGKELMHLTLCRSRCSAEWSEAMWTLSPTTVVCMCCASIDHRYLWNSTTELVCAIK